MTVHLLSTKKNIMAFRSESPSQKCPTTSSSGSESLEDPLVKEPLLCLGIWINFLQSSWEAWLIAYL